ncbi:MAG: hypothetical protein KA004_04010 [Verrucomicrobiales bacterium]|nr:hypothetical protein [Verrucomicrobiales bacterium]
MKIEFSLRWSLSLLLPWALVVRAETPKSDPAAQELVSGALGQVLQVVAPSGPEGLPISVELKCSQASGGLKLLDGQTLRISYQHPSRLRLEATVEGHHFILGRDGEHLWVHVPEKKFALDGSSDVPRFSTRPDSVAKVKSGALPVSVPRDQLALLPAVTIMNLATDAAGNDCVKLQLTKEAAQAFKMPGGQIQVRLGGSDRSPDQLSYQDGDEKLVFDIVSFSSGDAVGEETWTLRPNAGDKVEKVAAAHLDKFVSTLLGSLTSRIPTLPPAKGERKVVATCGEGRLENWDGTRVLFLKGTPEEMGRQHGTLLKKEIRSVVDKILYGVGVASSFEKGRWFFSEIEEAQRRQAPFVDARYTREMDAIAAAAGLDKEELRLANYFPELFHCSGFALMGKATADGKIYHGRILDYLKGVGLEENAVVMVVQPEVGNAWANISYAGFVGSVTGMNEKQVAIGEMGGRGEGNWDGKPMAQLMREVMEKAGTIDEALEIMRKGPRTCEYYYVISDAKAHKAVGLKTTPDVFEMIWDGEKHPQLPDALEDCVLLSAGDRYVELVRRAKTGFGKFTADSARDLMTKPVCMSSNIHSVLFCPDTLDFWVANADSQNVASHTRYTAYNLRKMLGDRKP